MLKNLQLIAKCAEISREIHKNHYWISGEPAIEHHRRIASRASLNDWPDYIVAACWVYDTSTITEHEDYLNLLEEIKEFNTTVAKIVQNCRKTDETEREFMKSICMSPNSKAVMWLALLDMFAISQCKKSYIDEHLEYLSRLFPLHLYNL